MPICRQKLEVVVFCGTCHWKAWQVARPACQPIDWWHFEWSENDFACMTPGCSYSYSIKPMNKPTVCFPADKVIAIDLRARRVTITKSVCRLAVNVKQHVCLFSRKESERWFYQWNGTEGDKTSRSRKPKAMSKPINATLCLSYYLWIHIFHLSLSVHRVYITWSTRWHLLARNCIA